MANKYIKLLLLLILVAGILFGLKYFSVGQNVGDFPVVDFSKSGEGTSEPIDYEVVEVVRGLFVPWSIVFTSDNRILVSERSGAIRVVENGKLLDKPLISFSVSSEAEDGLMGIELDPDYEEAYRDRATAYEVLGKKELAMEDFLKAKELKESGKDTFAVIKMHV